MLVLIMTLALAGVAMSAVYLASSAGLMGRFHDRDRTLSLAVDATIERARSRVLMDTTVTLLDTGYVTLINDDTLTEAGGTAVSNVRVSAYIGLTGDTSGFNGRYLTILATASWDGVVRRAARLDMTPEQFQRFGAFYHTFPSGVTLGSTDFVRGRAWSNARWRISNTVFWDTVTTVTGMTGTGTYRVIADTAIRPIPFPDTTRFTNLAARATAGNLRFTPVSGSSTGWGGWWQTRGTRMEFLAFDADNGGTIDSTEGFFRVFDLATGMDTTRLRASMTQFTFPVGAGLWGLDLASEPVLQHQCGAFYTIGGREEFFTIAAHRSSWVTTRIQTSTNPVVSAATAALYAANNTNANRTNMRNIMIQKKARCFPAGSPFLLTSERFTNSSGTVTGSATSDTVPWGVSSTQYGGQDTTFTITVRTCTMNSGTTTTGRCLSGTHSVLGAWRVFPGTAPTGISTSVRQAIEAPYLWPLSAAYNSGSRGVVRVDGTIYLSGTMRGYATVYVMGRGTLIDDLKYDAEPTDSTNLCRNQLGLIFRDSLDIADGAMVRPQMIQSNSTFSDGMNPFYMTPLGGDRDLTLHASVLAMGGALGNEGYSEPYWYWTGSAWRYWYTYTQTVRACPANSSTTTASGCLNRVGALVALRPQLLYGGSSEGMRERNAVDPCQTTNRRPPWFPETRRFTPFRQVNTDPRAVDSATEIRALFTSLRGPIVP